MAGFEPRLPTKGAAPAAASPAFTPQAAPARGVGGWPTKAAASSPNAPQPAPVAQREAIRARVSAPAAQQVVLHEDQTEQDHEVRGAAPATGRGFFSKAVQTAIAPETELPSQEEVQAETEARPEIVVEPKVRAPRSRKTDTADNAGPTQTIAAPYVGAIPANRAASAISGETYEAVRQHGGISLNFAGLPPAAIKAALQAIFDNL